MPKIDVSYGELLDKITILQIKKERLGNTWQLNNIIHEESILKTELGVVLRDEIISELFVRLLSVNYMIWDDMDIVFKLEGKWSDPNFQEAVRRTIDNNRLRAYIKRDIDIRMESHIKEAKSYFSNEDTSVLGS